MGAILGSLKKIRKRKASPSLSNDQAQKALEKDKVKDKAKEDP